MSYTKFFNKTPIHQLDSLDELRDFLSTNDQFDYERVDPATVALMDDGKIKFGNNELPISLEGAHYFFRKVLKIPDPFSKRIPFDLLQRNVERLSRELDDNLVAIVKNNQIVNLVKSPYTPINTLNLIDTFSTGQVRRIEASDLGVKIQTSSPLDGLTIEPVEGDLTEMGYDFSTSVTGFENPTAKLLLYTLVCSNGAIAPTAFGKVKIKLKYYNVEPELLRSIFREGLDKLISKGQLLKSKIEKMPNTPLEIRRLKSVVNASVKVVGDEETVLDKLELTDEDWAEVKAKAKDPTTRYDQALDFNVYHAYSKITNLANQFNGYVRKKLQATSGKMLTWEELN